MRSQFRIREEVATDQAPWGQSRWLSHPASTGARQVAALDADLAPGQGHSFHKHPDQEEVLCVIDGEIEQWIDREKRILRAGDGMFIAPGTVHATFNAGGKAARLLVIFSPCVGDGFEAVDMSGEAPWRELRA
ncbi:MAG: cupin domain-containing protein [Rhizobiaceae bacterium]|nr:cupin domain-containing protein [Rhizobiaceae bacterium]